MDAILSLLFDQPFSKVLGVAGILFLVVAIGGKVAGRIEPDRFGRIAAGAIGAIFILLALLLPAVSGPTQPTASQGNAPTAAPKVPPTQPAAPTVTKSATSTAGTALHVTPLGDLRGHTGPIRSVSFNANGSKLLSGSEDGKAIVWDIAGARSTRETPQRGPVDAVAWSPGTAFGDVVASVAWDRQLSEQTVAVWSSTSGAPTLPDNMRLVGHTNRIRSLAWAPDGKVIASSADDATVRIWAPGDNAPLLATLNSDHGAVNTVTWIGTDDKPARLVAARKTGPSSSGA